jgi:hypothetical protein
MPLQLIRVMSVRLIRAHSRSSSTRSSQTVLLSSPLICSRTLAHKRNRQAGGEEASAIKQEAAVRSDAYCRARGWLLCARRVDGALCACPGNVSDADPRHLCRRVGIDWAAGLGGRAASGRPENDLIPQSTLARMNCTGNHSTRVNGTGWYGNQDGPGVLYWNSGVIASPWLTSSLLVLRKPRIFFQRGFFLRGS